MKKLFTKLDLCQEYDNIWIKKRNEWKAAFITLEGLFEPMMMFFGLANSSATFQTIINKILWNIINIGEVASFIDNVIVGTEKKEGYNEVVEKLVKRLAENDLYVKLEKYKWKIREVRFSGVVTGPEGIKMEKQKMKGVFDWLTPREVKDIQKFLRLSNYYQLFIKYFAVIARLLYDLAKKDQKQDWTERQEKVFQRLKE